MLQIGGNAVVTSAIVAEIQLCVSTGAGAWLGIVDTDSVGSY